MAARIEASTVSLSPYPLKEDNKGDRRVSLQLGPTEVRLEKKLVTSIISEAVGEHPKKNLLNGQVKESVMPPRGGEIVSFSSVVEAVHKDDGAIMSISRILKAAGSDKFLNMLSKGEYKSNNGKKELSLKGGNFTVIDTLGIVAFDGGGHMRTLSDAGIRRVTDSESGKSAFDIISKVDKDPRDGTESVFVVRVTEGAAAARVIDVNNSTEKETIQNARLLGRRRKLLTDAQDAEVGAPDTIAQVYSGGKVFRSKDNPYKPGDQKNTPEDVYPNGW